MGVHASLLQILARCSSCGPLRAPRHEFCTINQHHTQPQIWKVGSEGELSGGVSAICICTHHMRYLTCVCSTNPRREIFRKLAFGEYGLQTHTVLNTPKNLKQNTTIDQNSVFFRKIKNLIILDVRCAGYRIVNRCNLNFVYKFYFCSTFLQGTHKFVWKYETQSTCYNVPGHNSHNFYKFKFLSQVA